MFDGLGSERTVTNSSQAVTGTATYEGFGQTVATTGSNTDPYMFAAKSGYRNDGDCGLSLVGARYYDSQVGRFQTRDTVLSQHPYAYCDANPVNRLDPSGHAYASISLGLLGMVGRDTGGSISISVDQDWNIAVGGSVEGGFGPGLGWSGGIGVGGGPGSLRTGGSVDVVYGGFAGAGPGGSLEVSGGASGGTFGGISGGVGRVGVGEGGGVYEGLSGSYTRVIGNARAVFDGLVGAVMSLF